MAIADHTIASASQTPQRSAQRQTAPMPFAAKAGVAFAVGTLLLVAASIIFARWPALLIDLRSSAAAILCL
ncbi:MAG: hypothetical protein AAFO62_10560 [Pseudomonadota bacterium]